MAMVTAASVQVMARLPAAAALLLGFAALAVVTIPGFWALVRHIDVMAHEGAHAVVGSCLDTRVDGVRLNRDGTGVTWTRTVAGSGVITGLVGYLGPSGFGLAAAGLIAHGLIVAVLWSGVVLLAILLPSVRNPFGIMLVIGTGFALFSIAHSSNAGLETVTAYGLSWVLLLSGLRSVLEHGTKAGDAGNLRQITHLPRGLWHGLWLTGTVLALAFGCTLLI